DPRQRQRDSYGPALDPADVKAGMAPPTEPKVLVTFDDGHRDNLEHALPILERLGVKALFFVITDLVEHAPDTSMTWDELDRLTHGDNPDAHYLRSVGELVNGFVSHRDLLATMKLRRDDDLVSTSVMDVSGRHLDALLVAQLAQVKGEAAANQYLELCTPWTDAFFERSRLRQHARRP
ncbi:polysaccharide deacetylase family protein, partial [Kibdelosporangium lantanae]